MHEVQFMLWHLIFLCQKHARLNYDRLYTVHPRPIPYTTRLWLLASRLPRYACLCVRRKIHRFLRTSGKIWCGSLTIKVPSRSDEVMSVVRCIVSNSLNHFRAVHGLFAAEYVRKRIRITRTAIMNAIDLMSDHRQTARSFNVDNILHITPKMHNFYLDRLDVSWLQQN